MLSLRLTEVPELLERACKGWDWGGALATPAALLSVSGWVAAADDRTFYSFELILINLSTLLSDSDGTIIVVSFSCDVWVRGNLLCPCLFSSDSKWWCALLLTLVTILVWDVVRSFLTFMCLW